MRYELFPLLKKMIYLIMTDGSEYMVPCFSTIIVEGFNLEDIEEYYDMMIPETAEYVYNHFID